MTEFDYERDVYNRNFLNCSQRQGIVALESLGYKTANLFYNAQISTDVIREQIFLNKIPRYDFLYDGLQRDDYLHIGVKFSEINYHRFEDIIDTLVACINRDSFVLVSCDVFLVPHRPEFYYKKHINHFVTLLSYDAQTEQWQAIDDVSSGHLATFTFTTEYLCEICNASKEKVIRVFEKLPDEKSEAAGVAVDSQFAQSRAARCDNFLILDDIAAMENDKSSMESMANVFAIIMGSRLCFAKFLQQYPAFTEAEKLSQAIATEARALRDMLNIYAATGSLKRENLLHKVENLVGMEKRLSALLEG
ncbi:hypothetical protein GWD52_14635 [Enterobacteriaceae bacterium 4M9]|nr:hypothetical protein [Enterobacteriaceae bacterium 4M9]